MIPGMYLDVSMEQYHSGPGLSRSDLINILRSPAHYKLGEDKEETAAMLLGEALHLKVLQPDIYAKRYFSLPTTFDGRTNAGKTLKAEIEAKGQTPLKAEDAEHIDGMAKALRSHKEIASILSNGVPEVSIYWYDPRYPGILLKCRLDWLNTKESIVLDLKSTVDARPEQFVRIAYNFGYHVQAGHYLSGVSIATKAEHRRFMFGVVEKEPPYGVELYQATQEFIAEGQKKQQEALAIYQNCADNDSWLGYTDTVKELGLPPWATKKNNVIFEG
ncbi:MAG: PD-(D/E)XK nuclease-like domain-containing protein [Magnetococcus sp. WYHC-3]